MPYAEFQPSHAGSQLQADFLRSLDTGASLMERAARNRALMQGVAESQQRLAVDTALSPLVLQRQQLELSRQENVNKATEIQTQLAIDGARQRSRTLEQNAQTIRQLQSGLPVWLKAIDDSASEDGVTDLVHQFRGQFEHLHADPDFSAQYAPLEGRLAARVATRVMGLRAQADKLYASALTATTPDDLSALQESPHFVRLVRDPRFEAAFEKAQERVAAYVLQSAPGPAPGAGVAAGTAAPASPAGRPAAAPSVTGGELLSQRLRSEAQPSRVGAARNNPWFQ